MAGDRIPLSHLQFKTRSNDKRGASVLAILVSLLMTIGLSSVHAQELVDGRDAKLEKALRRTHPQIQKLITKTCLTCHGEDDPEAGMDLSSIATFDEILKNRRHWAASLKAIQNKEMPPKDEMPFKEADRSQVIKWLEQLMYELDCGRGINAGTVTIRRLNRVEYRNSIRELTGVDYVPASDFPGDDVGEGFDNVADTLSLPPILFEKYLKAAEKVTVQAIVDPTAMLISSTLNASDFRRSRGSHVRDRRVILTTNGTITSKFRAGTRGKYQFEVLAEAQHAGPDGVEYEILIDGRSVRKVKIPKSRNESTIQVSVTLKKGEHEIGLRFTNDFYDPNEKDRSQRDRNIWFEQVTIESPKTVDPKDLPSGHRRIVYRIPDKETTASDAARRIIKRFAFRAFRRPVEDREIEKYVKLFELASGKEKSFEAAIRIPIQAILVSPQFLFKIEQPLPNSGKIRELGQFELATSLSFFLWSSTPDDELLTEAFNSTLKSGEELDSQITRLLKDPRSASLVDQFAHQWLNLDLLAEIEPDPKKFPGFSESLRADMLEETRKTVEYIIRNDRSILEFLTADYTFLNERLAKHYGIPNVKGRRFRKVSVARTGRGGIVTQGSIMTMTSHPTRTSPVKRGMWVMSNLLGEQPPPPDPNVMPLEDQKELTGSLRQKLEQHRKDPSCASCHDRIDPLGFAFENFDAVGKWRTEDEGIKIDASSKLLDGQTFDNALELQKILTSTRKKQFVETFVSKMLTYATGRGMTEDDRCTIIEISEKLEEKGYRFSELVRLICHSKPFRYRQKRDAGSSGSN